MMLIRMAAMTKMIIKKEIGSRSKNDGEDLNFLPR